MGDQRAQPETDRILVAQLTGEARHHARWRPLTGEEEAAALAELRALAGGRADLLAEGGGVFEGTSGGGGGFAGGGRRVGGGPPRGRARGAAGPVRRPAMPPGRSRPGGHTGLDRGRPSPLGERQAAPVLRLTTCERSERRLVGVVAAAAAALGRPRVGVPAARAATLPAGRPTATLPPARTIPRSPVDLGRGVPQGGA